MPVSNRIMGLLLAVVAIQFMIDGLKAANPLAATLMRRDRAALNFEL